MFVRKEIIMPSLYKSCLLFFYSIFLSSCNHYSITKADLQHHRFLPIKLNGQNIIYHCNQNINPIFIEFGENSTINGHICNAFNGKIELTKNNLKTTYLSSTDQLCDDPLLTTLDAIVTQLLQNGSIIHLKENNNTVELILKNSHYQLVLQLNDLM